MKFPIVYPRSDYGLPHVAVHVRPDGLPLKKDGRVKTYCNRRVQPGAYTTFDPSDPKDERLFKRMCSTCRRRIAPKLVPW